jgi:flagellar biosynthetic protein FliQ
MTGDMALQLVSQMLWAAALIAAPILLLTMLVGVLVSIIQVVTQIQEASLAFVPKLVAVVLVISVFGSWMLRKLVAYSRGVIASIPGYL